MSSYKHQLTDIEQACRVTLEQVTAEARRALVRGDRVILPGDLGPALADSVARYAAEGPVQYVGMNQLGHLVYRMTERGRAA